MVHHPAETANIARILRRFQYRQFSIHITAQLSHRTTTVISPCSHKMYNQHPFHVHASSKLSVMPCPIRAPQPPLMTPHRSYRRPAREQHAAHADCAAVAPQQRIVPLPSTAQNPVQNYHTMVDPGDLWRGGPGRARPSPLGRGTASRRTPEPAAPSAGPSEWRAPAANPATEDGGLFGGPRQSLSTGGFGGLRDHIHFDTRNMTGAFTIRSHAGGRNIDIQRYVPPRIYQRREGDPPDQGVGDLGAFPVCMAPCNNPLVSLQAQSISTYDPDAAEEEAVIDPEFARRRFVYDRDGGGLRMEAPLPLGPHAAGEAAAHAAAAADGAPAPPLSPITGACATPRRMPAGNAGGCPLHRLRWSRRASAPVGA